MARSQGTEGLGGAAQSWLDDQAGEPHRVLARDGWPDVVFAFHDRDEIGPNMLARIAKVTGLRPDEL